MEPTKVVLIGGTPSIRNDLAHALIKRANENIGRDILVVDPKEIADVPEERIKRIDLSEGILGSFRGIQSRISCNRSNGRYCSAR